MVSESAVDQIYEIRTHPMLDVLDRPDPWGYYTRQKLIGLLVSYCDVVGQCGLVPEGNGWDWRKPGKIKGPPEYLWVLYGQYMIPIRYAASPLIDCFQYFSERIPFSEVVWFRHSISLRDPYGSAFSPTYAGETYRRQEQEQVSILSQVLGLGPRPNLIASAKDPMMKPGDNERRRFEQDLVRKLSAGNAGGILVNDGAWDFTPVSYSPADMAGIEMSQHDRDVLASIFDMPPTYFTTDSNLANLQAADEQHARQGVEPRCRTIEGTLNNLVRQWDPRLFFRFDEALPEDEESRMKVVEMRLKNGLTTPNQENEEGKWPAFPEGDEHWIDGTRKTMGMILEQHTQAMQTQQTMMESTQTKDDLASDSQDHTHKMDKERFKLEKKAANENERTMTDADVMALCTAMLETVAR
jgi:hypothetical protein